MFIFRDPVRISATIDTRNSSTKPLILPAKDGRVPQGLGSCGRAAHCVTDPAVSQGQFKWALTTIWLAEEASAAVRPVQTVRQTFRVFALRWTPGGICY